MTALLLLSLAHADPVALRAPGDHLTLSVGAPDSSVGLWLRDDLGVSLDLRGTSAMGASVGWRRDLVRGERGLGLELTVAGGPMVPFYDPGLALACAPALQVGWVKPRLDAELGLAVPALFRLAPGADAYVPVMGELWLGTGVGPVRFGLHLGMGSAWAAGSPSEVPLEAGIELGFSPA